MSAERFVVLGLARVGADWFHDVARWATNGVIAAEFHKVVSTDEARAALAGGRPASALLVDATVAGFDRDLVAAAAQAGAATIVVDGRGRDWSATGVAAMLRPGFGPSELEATLSEVAAPVIEVGDLPDPVDIATHPDAPRARTVAVLGAGGAGSSTVAAALAQGLHGDTVLADLALHADQAMLQDVGDVLPGVPELVDAFRSGAPSEEQVRSLTFHVTARDHHLLLGLRRHRDWTVLRPRSVRAALDGLRRTFALVVADVDADLEGEAETGSADVEDRNLLARTVVDAADVVVVLGVPGLKGTNDLLRLVRDVQDLDVPAERLVPVVNRAPRHRRHRAELLAALIDLGPWGATGDMVDPVMVPDRSGVEQSFRDGAPLPRWLVDPLCAAVAARLDAVPVRAAATVDNEPVPVAVGSLGSWSEEATG